jgi:amidohydrolase
MLTANQKNKLWSLRQYLHRFPEISGNERNTAKSIEDFIKPFKPDEIITQIGGHGLAAIFNGDKEGPATMIRCELDALPIKELNTDIEYASTINNVSHKCGHDGHMAIVAGLALDLKPKKGKVILLFQPAEETGQGARMVIQDSTFESLKPNYVFALHNLPGFPINEIVLRKGTFCAASTGVKIKIVGETAHAAAPETGNSPALVVAKLLPILTDLPNAKTSELNDFTLITMTHVQIGAPTFGISPADAKIFLTLRAYDNQDLNTILNHIKSTVDQIAKGFEIEITQHESFNATVSHDDQVDLLQSIASQNNLHVTEIEAANRWSEDFGLFLQQCPGAIFGLGSGTQQPPLHNHFYDFPDELIETGIKMFKGVIKALNH